MTQYQVTGMSCAACSAHVEKAVRAVNGVEEVSVSLLTNSMQVSGSASQKDIIEAVKKAGYGASIKGENESGQQKQMEEDQLADHETPVLIRRLLWSIVFLCPLMYLSMGHMMWGWPLPGFLSGNLLSIGILQMILAAIVMLINQKFFVSGFRSVLHKSPNMDTLVAMGSGTSFLYSLYALFAMSDAVMKQDDMLIHSYAHEFYFESAAMILTLITVGKMLEAHSKGKTTNALKGLMNLAPKQAVVLRDGIEQTIPISEVKKQDIFFVKPGESIPVDGIIIEGESALDESALTGESIPVDKTVDDPVYSATINQSGYLKCQATRVGQDTTLAQIIKMVSDAAATKAPIAKIADQVSGVFVPVVIGIAFITFVVWMVCGYSLGFAIARAVSVLVISCPCALGLATPVAIMVGNGMGAKNSVLFKTAVALEETGKIQTVVLDKTGTITKGEPSVTDILAAEQVEEEELLKIAYSMEGKSEHPLAKAIISYGQARGVEALATKEFHAVAGNGISCQIENNSCYGGSLSFIVSKISLAGKVHEQAECFAAQGKTPLLFLKNDRYLGMIAVSDVVKEDSKTAIEQLKNMGIHVVMLTGDNEKTAEYIGKQVGVDQVIAGVMPAGKEQVINKLTRQCKTAMVGDGINDAPALTKADIGIAIGAGADIAVDAADVVLMKNSLLEVPAAIRLSRAVRKNIKENLFWAFIYNMIGIPLAAGVWYPLFGLKLNPMFGAAAMSLSSFCVVTNALRLNLFDVHSTKKDKKVSNVQQNIIIEKGDLTMEKTMKIKGMMCVRCEAHVKKALEALPEVDEAIVSHEAGTAIVKCNAEISDEALKVAVTEEGYEVL